MRGEDDDDDEQGVLPSPGQRHQDADREPHINDDHALELGPAAVAVFRRETEIVEEIHADVGVEGAGQKRCRVETPHPQPLHHAAAQLLVGEQRVDVELGDLRQVGDQAVDAQEDVDHGGAVGHRAAAEPVQQRERRERADHRVGLQVGERETLHHHLLRFILLADDTDHLVDIGDSDGEADEDMRALGGVGDEDLADTVLRTSRSRRML